MGSQASICWTDIYILYLLYILYIIYIHNHLYWIYMNYDWVVDKYSPKLIHEWDPMSHRVTPSICNLSINLHQLKPEAPWSRSRSCLIWSFCSFSVFWAAKNSGCDRLVQTSPAVMILSYWTLNQLDWNITEFYWMSIESSGESWTSLKVTSQKFDAPYSVRGCWWCIETRGRLNFAGVGWIPEPPWHVFLVI